MQAKPMQDKICLVTGATAGIGRITAEALAQQGAETVIAGRNPEKLAATVAAIQTATGSTAVHALQADFADLTQVGKLADKFRQTYPRLDVLVNNAGAFFNTRQRTAYGVEKTLLVNHLAPFLLTLSLLESIQASPAARIVNVSSDAHQYGRFDFDDLEMRRGYSGMRAYARSKLANLLFTQALARRLAQEKITVNALHPGHVATDIWQSNFGWIGPLLKWVMGFFAVSPEQGAENSIYLAIAPEVAGVTGKYFVKNQAVPPAPQADDRELAEQLWQVSLELTGVQTQL